VEIAFDKDVTITETMNVKDDSEMIAPFRHLKKDIDPELELPFN
jgi:hypothetical protein